MDNFDIIREMIRTDKYVGMSTIENVSKIEDTEKGTEITVKMPKGIGRDLISGKKTLMCLVIDNEAYSKIKNG